MSVKNRVIGVVIVLAVILLAMVLIPAGYVMARLRHTREQVYKD